MRLDQMTPTSSVEFSCFNAHMLHPNQPQQFQMKDVQFIDLVLAFSPSWMIPSTWDSFLDVSGFRTSWVHELYQIFRRLKFGDSPSTPLKKNAALLGHWLGAGAHLMFVRPQLCTCPGLHPG